MKMLNISLYDTFERYISEHINKDGVVFISNYGNHIGIITKSGKNSYRWTTYLYELFNMELYDIYIRYLKKYRYIDNLYL